MTRYTSRIACTIVMGFVLFASAAVNAKGAGSAAEQLFNIGSTLIKEDKINAGIGMLKRSAEKGHGRAAFEVASLYEAGLVVEKDFRQAKRFYEIAVRGGYRDAHFNLGLLLSSPMTPNNDLKRAREVVSVIAEQGDVEAQFLLATLMKKKLQSASAKPGKAFYWLQHAANSGHGKAQFNLATQYMKGEHVPRNTKTALKWFKRAALQNISEAHYNLAVMYEKGDGLPSNMSEAIKWYQSAAELGNLDAQQNLGIKYLAGDYLEPMPHRGIKLLKQAANAGSRNSQLLLGKIYQAGYKGRIKIDLVQAQRWYLKAARQGKTEAQYQLALMLLEQEESVDEAKFWIRRAVAAGHTKAAELQANL